MILPFSIAVIIAAAATGRLISRVGTHPVLLGGLTLITTSIVLVATWPHLTTVMLAGLASGAGNRTAAVAAYALATSLAAEYHGAAAGLLDTAAQIGTAVVV